MTPLVYYCNSKYIIGKARIIRLMLNMSENCLNFLRFASIRFDIIVDLGSTPAARHDVLCRDPLGKAYLL